MVSHLHADHLGAMDRVLQEIGAVACFDNGRQASTMEFQEYDSTAGVRRVAVAPGDAIDMGPAVQADLLHGDVGSSNENNNSVVLRLTHGSNKFLFGGDCESGCEVVVAARTYLSVARSRSGFYSWFGHDPDVSGLNRALGNKGDRLSLRDQTTAEIDFVAWEGNVSGWNITANKGDAIERQPVTQDTDSASDWVVSSPAAPHD